MLYFAYKGTLFLLIFQILYYKKCLQPKLEFVQAAKLLYQTAITSQYDCFLKKLDYAGDVDW